MKALSTTVIIHVSDLRKAVAYYTDILGFEIDFEYGEYVGLNYERLTIHLSGPTYQGLKKAGW